MAKAKAPAIKEIPVQYKSVTFGDAVATIGCSAPRGSLSVTNADKTFTARQVNCELQAGVTANENPDQKRMFKEGDFALEGVFKSNGFSVTSSKINFSLSIPIKELPKGSKFECFAKKSGRIEIRSVEDIEAPEEGEEGEPQ
jgi:hypothetical protein